MFVQSYDISLAAGLTEAENGSQLTVSQLDEIAVENEQLRTRVARAEADRSVRAACLTGPTPDPCLRHAAMPGYLRQSMLSFAANVVCPNAVRCKRQVVTMPYSGCQANLMGISPESFPSRRANCAFRRHNRN